MQQKSSSFRSHTNSQLPFGPKTLVIGASVLIAYGLTRRSKPGKALATAGGAVALAAVAAQPSAGRSTAKAVFLVNASPEKAYALWRDFQNLPRFMAHLKSVRVLDDRHSEWVALGPLETEIRWRAEVTEDRRDQRIAWRSVPGSDIETSGFVDFRPDPQGRGTFVTARVQYSSPAKALANAVAALSGKHPEFMVREDLRRFKALLEAGEAPTTAGQTHGPRGLHGRAERILFRETTNHPEPQNRRTYSRTA
jgi:uncharacterized membrane protein